MSLSINISLYVKIYLNIKIPLNIKQSINTKQSKVSDLKISLNRQNPLNIKLIFTLKANTFLYQFLLLLESFHFQTELPVKGHACYA